ncbi:MAG: NAD(P)H-binding protein [Polyangiaceae bacterium]
MNILVLGASKGTGALCVASALEKGHRVTAFARTPSKLALDHAHLTKLTGNFHDEASVRGAVKGHDAVLVTASVSSLSEFKTTPDYFSRGTRFAIDAMKEFGVRRLVVLSAFGAGESAVGAGWLLRTLMVNLLLKRPFQDHDVQEAATMSSGLEWVIARPSRLTDGPAKGRYVRETDPKKGVPSAISRADVADFMVEASVSRDYVDHAVSLGG